MQHYREGEYYHWHVDGDPGELSRCQLVAIWYLNDVPGPGGDTEFPLQEILVKPEAGELVLFPPLSRRDGGARRHVHSHRLDLLRLMGHGIQRLMRYTR